MSNSSNSGGGVSAAGGGGGGGGAGAGSTPAAAAAATNNSFPVNSALMIGDYVTPGSILLPTQGIHIPPSANSPSSH